MISNDILGNVIVYRYDWPSDVSRSVVPNLEGSHTIFINGNLSADKQFKAFLHDLKHMDGYHFDRRLRLDEIKSAI